MDKLVNDEAQAWRVAFAPAPASGGVPFAIVREPIEAAVVAETIDLAAVLADSGGERDSFDIVWLPPNARGALEIEKRADEWSHTSAGSPQMLVRASLRATRVIWTNTRIVIATTAENLHDAIDAVVRFTAAERALRAVEQSAARSWEEVDRLRASAAARLGRRRQWAELTEQAAKTQSAHLRLQVAIEQLDPTLATGSKRLYAELALQANLWDRLEMRADPIEFVNAQCELANSRRFEARESRRTVLIVLLIGAQLLVEAVYFFLPR